MTIKAILDHKGPDVVTIEPTASIGAAVKRLTERRIGALVVQGADNRIVGIISERDIVRALTRRGAAALDETVESVMTHDVHTCDPQETVARAMAQMTRFRYRHLPVVDHGKLVGMISIGDLVKHRVTEMEMETGVLRDRVIARS